MNRLNRTALCTALLTILASGATAGAAGLSPAREFAPRQVVVKFAGERVGHAQQLPAGVRVSAVAAALRRNPAVEYAAPDYFATASAKAASGGSGSAVVEKEPPNIPNDPGTLTGLPAVPGAWVTKQWNFLPSEGAAFPLLPLSPGGINAVGAWENLIAAKHPGGDGVTVAVLDTGIAYRPLGNRFRRSPDFTAGQFVKGYDFVNNSSLPLDRNGHGTHVAGTIAEKTNNGIGLAGIAYRAKLMPVRVLDRLGRGRADEIADGIRYATDHGAEVINMSFNFGCGKKVPGVIEAVRYASHRGVVLVASAGNLGSETCVSPPATIPGVIGVGGSTEGACLGNYSLGGKDIDLLAPGGGEPAAGCSSVLAGPIYQVTFTGANERRFGEPGFYIGTSMAAAHVSGVAALLLASGLIDRSKAATPTIGAQVTTRLKKTARSIGIAPTLEGGGLIDAARATDPECQEACSSHGER